MKIISLLPPTDNLIYRIRGKGMYMTAEAKQWKEGFGWLLKELKVKYTEEPVVIGEIHIYLKYDRDTPGGLKLMFDAMEGIYYKNDSQVIQFGPVYKHKDKNSPRMEIEIIEKCKREEWLKRILNNKNNYDLQ